MSRAFWFTAAVSAGAAAAAFHLLSGDVMVMIVGWIALGVAMVGMIDIWVDPTKPRTP